MGIGQRYEKLAVAQRKLERIILDITLRYQKRNTWIRQETGVSDIVNIISIAKHRWIGHKARLSENRSTIRATEWTARDWIGKHDGEMISPDSLDQHGQD